MRHGGLEKEALKLGGEKVISRRGERNGGGAFHCYRTQLKNQPRSK